MQEPSETEIRARHLNHKTSYDEIIYDEIPDGHSALHISSDIGVSLVSPSAMASCCSKRQIWSSDRGLKLR